MNNATENLGEIIVIGIPHDENSSYLRGAALAPPQIREAFFSESTNLWTESLIDLEENSNWKMVDDIEFKQDDDAFLQIENILTGLLATNKRVVTLGGDHSITYPIIKAYSQFYRQLNILQIDAHPDLYEELGGNRYSHACPFARIMEAKLVLRLVQVGIRTLTGHQNNQARRYGVEIIPMQKIQSAKDLVFDGPVYLSLDLDGLDPAYAPGVSHHEPGGMSTRTALEIIQKFKGWLVGADIVEYNPNRDINGVTGMVAAKLLKEILGRMLGESHNGSQP